ncbi:DUF1648 domain-containing protein [Actinotalea sp. AC32]|nr:DUF1648 domain-containing protein [Actinotalea sp. AC32]
MTLAVHAATWVVVVAAVAAVLAWGDRLPERVPVHFGLDGSADRWGSRDEVWLLLGLWVVLQAGVSLLARAPHVHNYPVEVTAANAQDLYRESERLLVGVGAAMAVAFGGALLATAQAEGAGAVVAAGTVGVLGACVVGVARLLAVGERRPVRR